MTEIRNLIFTFWESLKSVISLIRPFDFLDMLMVAFLVYQAIRLVRETRAMQLVKGIGIVFVIYLLADVLDLITMKFLITTILQWGIVAIAIVFQPELRRALEQVGRSRISNIGIFGSESHGEADVLRVQRMLDSVCQAAQTLSNSKTGALMVLERDTKLGDVIATGTVVDSEPSPELIGNIFFPNSPLHDGAMILRGGRVHAAGCFLPLSGNDQIGRELGTRHRAALGMSEVSDAVIVVVSEETGAISVALESKLNRNLSAQNLQKLLTAKLAIDKLDEAKPKKRAPWRKRK